MKSAAFLLWLCLQATSILFVSSAATMTRHGPKENSIDKKEEASSHATIDLISTVIASDAEFDEGAAEISAFDKKTNRIFVTNAQFNRVDVWDISNPYHPESLDPIDISTYGGGVNSVDVYNGLLAVAVENENLQDNGVVVFFSTANYVWGEISVVNVGANPDMVRFSPNGKYVLAANEGEPSDDYTVDPEGSITIIPTFGYRKFDPVQVDFQKFNSKKAQLVGAGVRIFGPGASVAQDLEPECIAFSVDSEKAYVTLQENNAVAIVDIKSATVEKIVPLGFKDHLRLKNAFDASDRDDTINIRPWPVFGMYQPDAIDSYQVDGKTYFVTANEGDARDYEGFAEEERVKNIVLDSYAFPDATNLKMDENLGRLTITTANGDVDNDDKFDRLYSFGARSFSIWDEDMKLVWDSKNQFEKIIAKRFPDFFNTDNDSDPPEDKFDSRSDNKGPEPEGIAVGKVKERYYAFIGLERVGGIMIYDVTDPYNPQFRDYVRTDGDLGPEGIKFISADASPLKGVPMLLVSNEVSGTTSLYKVVC